MTFRLLVTLGLFATAFITACSDDGKPCDPDQVVINRVCKPKPVEAGPPPPPPPADAEVDPDAPVVDAPSTPPPMDVAPTWGKACSMPGDAAVDCVGASNFCAAKPGATDGYCTALGCKDDPSICPIGWTCFDVGVTNFCAKPS